MITKDNQIRIAVGVFGGLIAIGLISHNDAFVYAAVAFLAGVTNGMIINR